jgi:hypothetical protein
MGDIRAVAGNSFAAGWAPAERSPSGGILWIASTRAPWPDLSADFGDWTPYGASSAAGAAQVYGAFRRKFWWTAAVMQCLAPAVLGQAAAMPGKARLVGIALTRRDTADDPAEQSVSVPRHSAGSGETCRSWGRLAAEIGRRPVPRKDFVPIRLEQVVDVGRS